MTLLRRVEPFKRQVFGSPGTVWALKLLPVEPAPMCTAAQKALDPLNIQGGLCFPEILGRFIHSRTVNQAKIPFNSNYRRFNWGLVGYNFTFLEK